MNTVGNGGGHKILDKTTALSTVRQLIDAGIDKEEAVENAVIPLEFRQWIREELAADENIELEPANMLKDGNVSDWFQNADRAHWYYWPTLRRFLLSDGWPQSAVNSLDDTTDKIMTRIPPPEEPGFDFRGLVLGYVQSGKTSNYTALIAKAADCGYRLFIVLSGTDNGLRLQTQIRLSRELMGYGFSGVSGGHVRLPPKGKQWHSFTTPEANGDFNPGNASSASLQGPEPVLMVIKKNGHVLKRLIDWLSNASKEILREIPTMVIDDEADLASIDTKGSYITDKEQYQDSYDTPSVINQSIRKLLNKFSKSVYVAYTATPFANILIPSDINTPFLEDDLYPKDFILDMPKPHGYIGAEELFGINDSEDEGAESGINVVRSVPDSDVERLEMGESTESLENAILGFILSGAARLQREQLGPTTMLIHINRKIENHANITNLVNEKLLEFKNDIRYNKKPITFIRMRDIWDNDFRLLTRSIFPQYDIAFDQLKEFIEKFVESISIRTINSETGQVLDFKREPHLKAICIGGDKLSRGLTLEGLVSSYYIRNTPYYDTLMQMGRWFGFRQAYIDLTRIWTTRQLADHFALLAFVENQLRQDIKIYEDMQLKPIELGMRIFKHPSMQVTAPLKRRFAKEIRLSQSYSGQLVQSFKYPFDKPQELAEQQDHNERTLISLINHLGPVGEWKDSNPIWTDIDSDIITDFISDFQQSDFPDRSGFNKDLVSSYIKNLNKAGELIRWTVAIRGLEHLDQDLGITNWTVEDNPINEIDRTRIPNTNSVGVVTSPSDEMIGLDCEEKERFNKKFKQGVRKSINVTARNVRSPEKGLLLIYPISKRSKPKQSKSNRVPLFEDEEDQNRRDLIAIAISFPESSKDNEGVTWVTNMLEWRSYDEEP